MKRAYLNSSFIKIKPMSAEQIGTGGRLLNIAYSFADTPLGEMLIASTSEGICYLAFVTDGREAVLEALKHLYPQAAYEQRMDDFQRKALIAIQGGEPDETCIIPLHLKGTDFQLSVWKELLTIPSGTVTSYGKIARKLQKPKACRAVGSAVGDNPVSILIPCHRVVRSDGALGGYHWGLDRKVRLLDWEKHINNEDSSFAGSTNKV